MNLSSGAKWLLEPGADFVDGAVMTCPTHDFCKQAAKVGIPSPFPDLLAVFFDRAIAAGHGQGDAMAIWKALT